MKRTGVLLLMLCTCLCAGAPELGSMAWFEARWQEAGAFEIPEKTYIEYEIFERGFRTKAEVEEEYQAIQNKPEHPDRYILQSELSRWEDGPERYGLTIWWVGDKAWRVNRDFDRGSVRSSDSARWRDNAWRTANMSQITYLDASLRTPYGSDPKNTVRSATERVRDVIFSGMAPLSRVAPELVSATWHGDQWVGLIAMQGGDLQYEYRGRREGDNLLIESKVLVRNVPAPDWVGVKVEYTDFKQLPGVDHPVPTRMVRTRPGKHVMWDARIRVWREATRDDISVVQRVLKDGDIDPVRGAFHAERIVDFRPGHAERIDRRTGVEVVTDIPNPQQRPATAGMDRYIGMGMAGVFCVSGVMIWRARRAS